MISKEQLQAAKLKATELETATVELANDLTRLEGILRGLKLGVSAHVPLTGKGHVLGFEKINNTWRLSYTPPVSTRTGEPIAPCPLLSAPRSMRLLAVDAVPRLFQALLASVQVEVTKVERATEELDDLIDAVALHAAKKADG